MIDPSQFIELLKDVPSQASVFIIGMTPVFELRGAIPVAMGAYKMSAMSAFFWSVAGNVFVAIILVLFLEKVSTFLSNNFEFWKKFFDWLFERTRKRAADKIEKYGEWGLYFLVAIPLPMTGGWTGALAAFLFGIPHRKSIPIITLGIITAGVIVLLITWGAVNL